MIKYISIVIIIVVGVLLFNNQDLFVKNNQANLANVSMASDLGANQDSAEEFNLSEIPKPKGKIEAVVATSSSAVKSTYSALSSSVYNFKANHYYEGKFWYSEVYTKSYNTPLDYYTFTALGDSPYVKFNKFQNCSRTYDKSCILYLGNPGNYSIDVYWDPKFFTVKTQIRSEFNEPNGLNLNLPDVLVNGKMLPKVKVNDSRQKPFKIAEAKFRAGTKLVFRLTEFRWGEKVSFNKWSGACSNMTTVCIIKVDDFTKDISVTANFIDKSRKK